jgi:hypothetical protein
MALLYYHFTVKVVATHLQRLQCRFDHVEAAVALRIHKQCHQPRQQLRYMRPQVVTQRERQLSKQLQQQTNKQQLVNKVLLKGA